MRPGQRAYQTASTPGKSNLLEAKAIKTALFGPLDICVKQGECVSIRGKSGCGKSIFLRAIADLDMNEGKIRLAGVERSSFPAYEWRRKVMLVPAESGWWADRVGEHFEKSDAAAKIIASLSLPGDVMDWQVARLSSGERQRLALARALNLKPQILLLDEPTAALDAEATAKVEAILQKEMINGLGIILVTHDEAQAGRMAQTRYVMADNRLSIEGEAG